MYILFRAKCDTPLVIGALFVIVYQTNILYIYTHILYIYMFGYSYIYAYISITFFMNTYISYTYKYTHVTEINILDKVHVHTEKYFYNQ